jgi:hypothetical protein
MHSDYKKKILQEHFMTDTKTKELIAKILTTYIPKIDNKLDKYLLKVLKNSNIDISNSSNENKEEILMLAREIYFKG